MDQVPSVIRTGTGLVHEALNIQQKTFIRAMLIFLKEQTLRLHIIHCFVRQFESKEKVDESYKLCYIYQILKTAGPPMEILLANIVTGEPIPEDFEFERYEDVIRHYNSILPRLLAGESEYVVMSDVTSNMIKDNTGLVEEDGGEWVPSSSSPSSESDSEEKDEESSESTFDEVEEKERWMDIVKEIEGIREEWDAFVPSTPIQIAIHQSVGRLHEMMG